MWPRGLGSKVWGYRFRVASAVASALQPEELPSANQLKLITRCVVDALGFRVICLMPVD